MADETKGSQPSRGENAQLRAEFEAAKLDKFRALVRHANANAPYYADIIRERGIDIETCIPEDFPVLTKSTLMANFDDIVTEPRISKQVIADFLTQSSDPKDFLFNKFMVLHTSGTTGEVGYFLYAPADRKRMRQKSAGRPTGPEDSRRLSRRLIRRLRRLIGRLSRRLSRLWPKRLRRLRMAFYGATGGHYTGVTCTVAMVQRNPIARLFINAEAFEVNTPLPAVVEQLNQFQPDMLAGYTTALKMLADQQDKGNLNIAPAAITAGGEMVTKADMALLSKSFGGARTSSLYACTEHMILGMSNPDGETMTLTDDNLIFEFRDDHSIVTNLFNYTMPLIRYRMSDILRPVSGKQALYTVVENLVGRTEQMPAFVDASGNRDFIHPITIIEIFVKGVTRFQLQITGESSFRFPICVDAELSAEGRSAAVEGVENRLKEICLQKGLGNVTFEVPIVEDIPINPRTRKFQLIVDTRG